MNWRVLSSGSTLLAGPPIGLAVLLLSANAQLWLNAFAALMLAVMLVSDRRRSYPVLIWAVGFNWLGIVAAIVGADLVGIPMADADLGPFRIQAVNYNLAALVLFAAGIAFSIRTGAGLARLSESQNTAPYEQAVTIQNGVIAYFASLVLAETASVIVANIPALQQPLIALYLLKFTCIYLVAATVFTQGRGYWWLVILLCVEVVNGLTSYFGTFKEAFFLVLIALVAVGRRPSLRMSAFGAVAMAVVVLLSLMWTALKPEYRRWVSGFTGEQRVVRSFDERLAWMADRLWTADIDYEKALDDMVGRIDSTFVFSQYLAREDAGAEFHLPSRYLGGLEHVLMPRLLFPDKPALDDSAITTAMTGRVINRNTSISIGYLAEAYYDFGHWWMFLPISIIGAALGAAGRYFMTRDAPYLIRQAFAATALFSFFQFGTNFNKALGSFAVGFAVLALVLKFGYPLIAQWLAGGSPKRGAVLDTTGAE